MCGYLPLAIGMLARQLRHHPARDPAELARELAAAHDRLAVMRAENLSVAAAFDLSYQDLTPAQQRLFRRLGPAPGTDIDAYAAAALDDVSLETARAQLDELYDQHLITEPAPGRYLLHDLLREHARTLAEADAGDSRAAAGRLVNYYAYVAAVASRHIATWTTGGGRLPPSRPPVWVPELAGSEQAAGWLEAERANLHAAAQQAEAGAMPQHAITIASAMGGFLRARGHWDQAAELYQTALNAAAGAGDVAGQAGALDELGLLQQITGNYPAATASLSRAAGLYRDVGDLSGQAYALNHLGLVQQDLSDYPAQAASHRQALDLARRSGDELAAAVSLVDLGQVQQWMGEYAAAVGNTEEALAVFRRLGSRFDEADALCQLGFARCWMGDHETATTLHGQALDLYRRVGDRLGQAWAHAGLGLVQMATGDYPAAASSLGLSLRTHLDLGSRHGQACALNYLGELAGLTMATEESRERHGRALAIARDLGAPLEEARALEGMGRSYLHSDPGEATAHLRRALAIYQRIGNPGALRTQAALDELGHRGP
jgi:tetratricopeptide (TPR) repeat protein